MKLEKFLTFVTQHNESIIQWLFFGILLLAGTLIARSIFSKKEERAAAESGGDLHSALERILAQTTKLESLSVDGLKAASASGAVPGASGGVSESVVTALKADLANREKELNELKAKGGAVNEQAAAQLNTRIKELEAKLAEYEILEDDIADLSLYKEENTRLKGELDRLKAGGASTPAPAAAPAKAAEPAPKAEDIVAEFAQAVDQKSADAVALAPAAAPAPEISIPDTGDPMADFESTVKLEKKLATPAPAPAAAAAPAPAPKTELAAPAVDPSASPAQAEADDLFAEFSAGGTTEESSGSLDTDKMMAEMAALVSMEPSSENALEEGIDTDKMAAEASSFGKS